MHTQERVSLFGAIQKFMPQAPGKPFNMYFQSGNNMLSKEYQRNVRKAGWPNR